MIEDTVDKKWVNKYLHTHYVGFIKGSYEIGCPLYLKEINNFVSNVGRYADLEIMRAEDSETLLNTRGIFYDHVWPDWQDKSDETIQTTNYIASILQTLRNDEGYNVDPLPKIKKYMKEVLGQDIVVIQTEDDLYESQEENQGTGISQI